MKAGQVLLTCGGCQGAVLNGQLRVVVCGYGCVCVCEYVVRMQLYGIVARAGEHISVCMCACVCVCVCNVFVCERNTNCLPSC